MSLRVLQGTLVSNRTARTVVVRVDHLRRHPKYRKFYRVSHRYKADVRDSAAYRIGDVVQIQETRPRSKDKRWKVVKVVRSVPRETYPAGAEAPPAGEAGDEDQAPGT